MNIIAFTLSMMIFGALNVHAIDIDKVTCVTDRLEYYQGDSIAFKITNNSNNNITIVDRKYIDGGFVVIEMKRDDGTWRAIELYAAANIITFKTLDKGESYTYIWNTKGYNRNDTLANPGIYRAIFSNGMKSNQFSIIVKANI